MFRLRLLAEGWAWSDRPFSRKLLPWIRKKQRFRRLGEIQTSWVLVVLALVTTAAMFVSVLTQGSPELKALGGGIQQADGVMVLDPNQKDETMLSPGFLYDRPVSVLQCGRQRVLLRVRLEEKLLTVKRDDRGLVVVSKDAQDPGENFVPQTISQQDALQLLVSGGFCKNNTTWAQAIAGKSLRVDASRFPNGDDQNGKLIVFQKVTVSMNSNVPVPDLDSLLPEDLDDLGLEKKSYKFLGFFECGDDLYQPLVITSKANEDDSTLPPDIGKISYQFHQWDVASANVHNFAQTGDVLLQSTVQPLKNWKKPTDTWFYDEDGWIYYGKVLEPGEMTPLLLESFSVEPESPLVQDETRYRLSVFAQTTLLDHKSILNVWNEKSPINGFANNGLSNDAANFAAQMLASQGVVISK
jgi:hypothetical protein